MTIGFPEKNIKGHGESIFVAFYEQWPPTTTERGFQHPISQWPKASSRMSIVFYLCHRNFFSTLVHYSVLIKSIRFLFLFERVDAHWPPKASPKRNPGCSFFRRHTGSFCTLKRTVWTVRNATRSVWFRSAGQGSQYDRCLYLFS